MTFTKGRGLATLLGAAALAVFFAFGYLVGSNSQKAHDGVHGMVENNEADMPFGNAKFTGSPLQSAHEPETKQGMSASLSGLVAGLEKKVAANPENIDQQLLLAQTYEQLGSREKGIKLLQTLNQKAPTNAQVKIIYATVLMASTDKKELQDASKLFDEAIKLKPDVTSMAQAYQKEIKAKLEGRKGASK